MYDYVIIGAGSAGSIPPTRQTEVRIKANYLSDPEDGARILKAAKMARSLFASEPLTGLVDEELLPGDGVHTDRELMAFIRRKERRFISR